MQPLHTLDNPAWLESAIIRDPVVTGPETPVAAAITALRQQSGADSCILVVAQEQVVGMITPSDIMALWDQHQVFETTAVQAVMTQPVITFPEAQLTDVSVIFNLFQEHHIHYLPLVDAQGHLTGLVTQTRLWQCFNPGELYQQTKSLATQIAKLQAQSENPQPPQSTPDTTHPINQSALIPQHIGIENQRLRERLQFLVTAGPAIIYSCYPDDDYGMTFITDNVQNILGYTPSEILTHSNFWLNHIHPEDLNAVVQKHRAVVAKQGNHSLEYRFQHQQGHYVWLRDEIRLVRDGRGNSLELVGYLADITERKIIEEKLRISAARLDIAQQTGKVGTWEYDVASQTLTCSPEVLDIFGFDPNHGTPTVSEFEQRLHPDDLPYFRQGFRAAIQKGQTYILESCFLRHDNTWGYFLARGEPLTGANGVVQKIQGTLLDISQRKETELQLQARTEELDRFFSLSVDLLFIGSRDGKILRLNQQWQQVFGYPLSDMEGRYTSDYIHPEDRDQGIRARANLLNGPQVAEFVNRFRAQDGSYRWLEWRAVTSDDLVFAVARDITESKATQEAIKNQLAAIELALDGIGILYHETHAFVNASYAQMFGYETASDLLGQAWQILYDPAEIARFELDILPTLNTQHFWQGEAIATRRDGTTFIQGLSLALVNRATIVCVCRDISLQKQAEQAMQQQAERERLLREIMQRVRQSLELPIIFDAVCEDVRRVIGADRVGIFKFDPQSNHDLGTFVAESVISDYPSVLTIPVQDHCFDEKYAPLYIQGRYAAMRDIYELEVCHTQVLAQFQVRANLVMPLNCGEGLWGLLCVHQCRGARDWQPTEIELVQQIATQLAIAIQQADLFEQVKEELRDRQVAQELLTERNQQLAISNEELQRATRLKDEFLANMSHELRTPLNAILGMTEGLQEKIFGPITVQQLTALKTIERSGSHLLDLINDILDVAKVESGQLELELVPTALLPLCESSLTFVKQAALKKRIEIALVVPDGLPKLLMDERRLRQVLINLLNNAVKFTPEGGRITLTVAVLEANPEAASSNHYIRVAVADTGIGIPPEHLERLFQPFVQIDSALNRKYAGTGLGLALVKRIVELHGGRVGLTSEVGVGSCFTVDLPYQPASLPPPQIPLGLPDTSVSSPPSCGGLILLAEDNEANISTISSYLAAKGYRLIFAKDGQAAVAMAEAERPDLILMDIQMPGLDGFAAIAQIRELPSLRHTPIIALTALAMTGDQERCLAAGATDYLAKPVKLRGLASKIQELLTAPSSLS